MITGNGELNVALMTTNNTATNMSSREGANPPQLVITIASDPNATPTSTPTATATSTPTNTPTPMPTATPQTSFTFAPVADSYVDSSKPTQNNGTKGFLNTNTSPDQRSYLRFNVQGLTTAVTSATLRVYSRANAANGYRLSQTAGGWTETGITYNNKPATGALVGTSGPVTTGAWTQVNVTSIVAGNGEINVVMEALAAQAGRYDPREGTNPPQLVVQVALPQAPAPSATPTSTPTATATNTPTSTSTATATDTPTSPPAATAAPTDTPTNPPAATATPTDTPTSPPAATATPTDTPTNPPAATATDTPTATATPTSAPAATATSTPTSTPTSAGATVLTFVPDVDTYVDASNPTTNYGSSAQLRTDASPVVNSLIRFNVTGITGPVTKATLRVFANTGNSIGYDVFDATATASTWTEGTLTYNNMPVLGAKLGASSAVAASTWTGVVVSSIVTGDGVYGFALTSTSATATSFSSRTGANPPQLVIEVGGAAVVAPSGLKAAAAPDQSTNANSQPADTLTDTDSDGVPDATELLNGTNINSPDTDGDGLPDLWEIESGISPTSAVGDQGAMGDPDHDGTTNLQEYLAGTDPLDFAVHP